MSKKYKIIFLINLVLISIMIVKLVLVYFNHDNSQQEHADDKNNLIINNQEYAIPKDYQYIESYNGDDTSSFFAAEKENWYSIVRLMSDTQLNSIDKIYNSYKMNEAFSNANIYKSKINNVDVVIVEFKDEGILYCDFINSNNNYYSIYVCYDKNSFEINMLDDLIQSLINAKPIS